MTPKKEQIKISVVNIEDFFTDEDFALDLKMNSAKSKRHFERLALETMNGYLLKLLNELLNQRNRNFYSNFYVAQSEDLKKLFKRTSILNRNEESLIGWHDKLNELYLENFQFLKVVDESDVFTNYNAIVDNLLFVVNSESVRSRSKIRKQVKRQCLLIFRDLYEKFEIRNLNESNSSGLDIPDERPISNAISEFNGLIINLLNSHSEFASQVLEIRNLKKFKKLTIDNFDINYFFKSLSRNQKQKP